MKKSIASLGFALAFIVLSGCTSVTAVTYDSGSDIAYMSTSAVYTNNVDNIVYDTGWYAGGPDYYNTTIYTTDW